MGLLQNRRYDMSVVQQPITFLQKMKNKKGFCKKTQNINDVGCSLGLALKENLYDNT